MKTNPNEPAFATPSMIDNNQFFHYGQPGVTKREYFAAMAMQGLVSGKSIYNQGDNHANYYTKQAVELADALINELNKEE